MRNSSTSKDPIVALGIPPYAPPAVEEARDRFEAVGKQLDVLKDEIHAAERAIIEAAKRDVSEASEAIRSGKTRDPEKLVKKAREQLAALEAALPAHRRAADDEGNALVSVIASHRAEWLAGLDPVETEAGERYRKALATAKDAAKVLAAVRASRAWLETFDAGQAVAGRVSAFPGGKLVVDARRARLDANRNPDVQEVLDLAAAVLEPVEEAVYLPASAREAGFRA